MFALFKFLIILALSLCLNHKTISQEADKSAKTLELKHAISTDPLLPLFNSFALVYEHKKTQRGSFIAGLWYGKATATYPKMYPYPGYAHNISPILAYRYYMWKNLHVEYQLYPGFTKYYEENENVFYNSFDIFNELRIGYKFEFNVFKQPLMLNVQYPVGFTLINSNEPASFWEIRKKDPVFYILYPNLYFGYRF